MTDFLTKLKNGGGLSLVREVSGQETRFLCYTSFSDSESLWGIRSAAAVASVLARGRYTFWPVRAMEDVYGVCL